MTTLTWGSNTKVIGQLWNKLYAYILSDFVVNRTENGISQMNLTDMYCIKIILGSYNQDQTVCDTNTTFLLHILYQYNYLGITILDHPCVHTFLVLSVFSKIDSSCNGAKMTSCISWWHFKLDLTSRWHLVWHRIYPFSFLFAFALESLDS